MSATVQSIIETCLTIVGAVGVIWFAWRSIKRSEDPTAIVFKLIMSAVVVGGTIFFIHKQTGSFGASEVSDYGAAFLVAGSTALCGIVLGVMWTPQISGFLFKPLTGVFDGGSEEPESRPFYSIARAKRKTGKFAEAIFEVRRQLEKFPADFEGEMLIAEIQAEDQKDLPGAEITIQRICNHDGHPPRSVAYALTQLADWHLKFSQDNEAARLVLEKIIEKFPQTEFAMQASQRIAHLAVTEHLLAAHDRKIFPVAEGVQNMGLLPSQMHPQAPEVPMEKQAADFIKQLSQHPLDMEAREKLTMIYARHYCRLDLAADQLEQMIGTPNQPPKLVAHWLNLLADFQIQLAGNYVAAREALERVIQKFPESAAAQVAQRRIEHLKLELKGQEKSQAVQLGSYEQDIGLKTNLPR